MTFSVRRGFCFEIRLYGAANTSTIIDILEQAIVKYVLALQLAAQTGQISQCGKCRKNPDSNVISGPC